MFHSPWLWIMGFTIIIGVVQYWSAGFLLWLLLWKAVPKIFINTSLQCRRWRYGSVEMSDKTGPHLTLIDCKPQRPLWIPKSQNWFWNESSSLKISVFPLHHIKKVIVILQELPCPFELMTRSMRGSRRRIVAPLACHDILKKKNWYETGKIS